MRGSEQMRRRAVRLLLILGMLAAALAAIHHQRREIAGHAARQVLEARGFRVEALRVAELGETAALIEDIRLAAPAVSAQRVRIVYDPSALARGRFREVRIEGLRLDASAGLEEIAGPLGAAAGGADVPVAVERIIVADARVALGAPLAGTVALDGSLRPGAGGIAADLDIALDLGPLTGRARVASAAPGGGGPLAISGNAALDLARAHEIAGMRPLSLRRGSGSLDVAGSLRLPARPDALAVLAGLDLHGRLRLDGLADATGRELSGDLGWSLAGRADGLDLALAPISRLEMRGVAPDLLQPFAPPGWTPSSPIVAETRGAGARLAWRRTAEGGTIEASADLRLTAADAAVALRLETEAALGGDFRLAEPAPLGLALAAHNVPLSQGGWSGHLGSLDWQAEGRVTPDGKIGLTGPFMAETADLNGPLARAAATSAEGVLDLAATASGWSLGAAPGLRLAADTIEAPGIGATAGPIVLTAGNARLEQDAAGTRIALAARVDPFEAMIETRGGPTALRSVEARLTVDADAEMTGRLALADVAATVPDHELSITGGSLALERPTGAEAADIALGAGLRDTAAPRRFPPAELTLAGRLDGTGLRASGAVAGAGLALPIEVTADLAAPAVEARLGPTRIAFRRKGLQPAALSPLLAGLRDVEGPVTLDGTIAAGAGGATTRLRLRFDDISASTAEADVEGLSGTVDLTGLAPPATAGTQRLRARRLIAGVPVTDADLRFSIQPGRRGAGVRIARASAALAGGTVAFEDAVWNTGVATNALTLDLRGLSLGTLLADWRIEGVSGTGTLSGTLPLGIGRAGIGIAGGRLVAEGPGIVRVDWGGARETLIAAGQQVELAVRALEDFHYQSLAIGVEQAPGGEMILAIRLEGANPAVLDGHPFDFNINLSGQLDRILAAVREGRRIGAGLLQGGLGGAR